MNRLNKVLIDGDSLTFNCMGCNITHTVNIGRNGWTWNGDFEAPTISPSVLVTQTKLTDKGKADYEQWCQNNYPTETKSFDSKPTVCHSFITNGNIKFLDDCTHELKGKTVSLPNYK